MRTTTTRYLTLMMMTSHLHATSAERSFVVLLLQSASTTSVKPVPSNTTKNLKNALCVKKILVVFLILQRRLSQR